MIFPNPARASFSIPAQRLAVVRERCLGSSFDFGSTDARQSSRIRGCSWTVASASATLQMNQECFVRVFLKRQLLWSIH
jgi:hypothetical protein